MIDTVDGLYAALDGDNRKAWKELWKARYLEEWAFLTAKAAEQKRRLRDRPYKDEDALDELAEMHLANLLDTPNAVTGYAYAPEVFRKRDRAKEAVRAAPANRDKRLALDRSVRVWVRMTGWYVDLTADGAAQQAMTDADVPKVMWNSQEDGKECDVCHERHGKIYPAGKVPAKPHPGCRCWISAVL